MRKEAIAINADEHYMRRALELAARGFGHVAPNPAVGAVIVRNGKVVSEGWHERFGGLHAERNAFAHLQNPGDAEGATLYVTLEPCCHWGKTPPCTDAIIEHKVARVVVGALDANPLVAGRGVRLLREAGIEVETGVLEGECREVNRTFFHYITTKRPYVIMKYAMTLDGKVSHVAGASDWLTGDEARRRVHEDRNRYGAILVGAGTVAIDDPQLTCRIEGGVNPLRVIADTRLRCPLDAQVVTTARKVPTVIATCTDDEERLAAYRERGVECAVLPEREGRVDLGALLDYLGGRGIDSVILEGGATLNASALRAGLVDEIQAYIAPTVFGGAAAPGPIGGAVLEEAAGAQRFEAPCVVQLGQDVLLQAKAVR